MPQAPAMPESLAPFEPGIRDWFLDSFRTPTEIQALAWPAIAAGEHVLVTAPTGSGKTLTAFLWALNQFAAGRWPAGATRVLYVSPLKALNNDIQRNLLTPLGDLTERGTVPSIRAQTRSGDTPQSDRQRMLRRPPEILITTPESLGLLLTTTRGRHALATIETVIVDEVHAVVDNRRGTLLLTALERLVHLAGEFQRIALSATVRPLGEVAEYVAGCDEARVPRPIRVLEGSGSKAITLNVRFPEAVRNAADTGTKIWEPMAETFREIIARNRATLFFANSRRLAERITAAVNKDQITPLAYAHHGSLSREIRTEVEARLKGGDLRAIVATSSLEMGIDIGDLDEVVMVQSPPTIAATLQRIGRAGHRVGETSRGILFPTFAQDFVEAAALASAVAERDIEPLTTLANPLDVLGQILVSMTATEAWSVEGIYQLLRRSGPYRSLPRSHFDLVLEMLAGRYAGARVRELKARVSFDRIHGTVKAQHSAVLALYNSGGVIPDRGHYHIRHADSGAVIGELDEEFVWEATTGQVFSLGTQNWRIQNITHNDVVVRPTTKVTSAPPFWRAESTSRSFHYSRRIAGFLEQAEHLLAANDADALRSRLRDELGFDAVATEELTDHLERQRQTTGRPLPHRRHLLVERTLAGPGGYRGPDDVQQLVIHSLWGGRVNKPWALALATVLRDEGVEVDVFADDNAVVIESRETLEPGHVLGLVSGTKLQPLLRRSLESSGAFGARFREAAGRALLLTRQRFNSRLPLWMSRLQAKKLMTAVGGFSDFPLLLEAWRSCLADDFDLSALQACLAEVEDGLVTWSTCTTTSPSPFAGNVSFGQINRYMYATDKSESRDASALSDDLIRSAVFDADLRPRVDAATVAAFEEKRQRRAPGYAPDSPEGWAEWIKERVLVPAAELSDLAETAEGAPAEAPAVVLGHPDLVCVGDGRRGWICHRELLGALTGSELLAGLDVPGDIPDVPDQRSAVQLALEMLAFYGPFTVERLAVLLPRVPDGLLDTDDTLIHGPLLADDETLYYCDADNFESLLRLQRARRRPGIEARPVTALPDYLAAWQGLDGAAGLDAALEALRGFDAPVAAWLHDLPAARCHGLGDRDLDEAFRDLGLSWQGTGQGRVRVGYPEDLALLAANTEAQRDLEITGLFADPTARYGFLQLADRQETPLRDFNDRWWRAVWNGEVSADALTPLRQGLERNFKLAAGRTPRTRSRSLQARARAPRFARSAFADPWSGTWFLTAPPPPGESEPADEDAAAAADSGALLELEDAKERVRMLVDRYGVACRELANREGGPMRWASLFRALRVMELAGEVVAGYFFHGLSGPQFAPPGAIDLLSKPRPGPASFWCNAVDPVSPCGLGLSWPELPQRRPQNYLAFRDGALALVIENLGKKITFHLPPEACDLGILAPLVFLLARRRRLTIDTVNDLSLRDSPYRPAIERVGRVVSDHRTSHLEGA